MLTVRAELTSKALSGILRASAAASAELEGLLLGRFRSAVENGSCADSVSNAHGNDADVEGSSQLAVVERFMLVGPAWSLCSPQGVVTDRVRETAPLLDPSTEMRVLGWCSIRIGCVGLNFNDSRMSHRERRIHEAFSSYMTGPVIGYVQTRQSGIGDLGSFILDSACIVSQKAPSIGHAPIELCVRSLGATASKEAGSAAHGAQLESFSPLPLLHSVDAVGEEIDAATRKAAVDCFAKSRSSLDQLCNAEEASRSGGSREDTHEPGARLHRQQRKHWDRKLPQSFHCTPNESRAQMVVAPKRPGDGISDHRDETGGAAKRPRREPQVLEQQKL